ncbi:MAG: glycerophosphodiester phosphodiesterase [Acidimicrobiales bacterium]
MPPQPSGSPVLRIAHRWGNEPKSVDAALAAGADLIEADIHLFRGRLEVRHLKTVGPVPLFWDRWELRGPSTPIASLEDLLEITDAPLLLDLKGASSALTARLAAMVGGRADIWVCSRRWAHIERLGEVDHLVGVPSAGSRRQLQRLLRRYGPGSLGAVSVKADLLSPAMVEALRVRAQHVFTWRVNDVELARVLVSWGVTGLISDRPDLFGRFAELTPPELPTGPSSAPTGTTG